MIVRKKFLPTTLSDFLSMSFVLLAVPTIYWFELWIVLPNLHETGSPPYVLHFIFGNFIMINIVGNLTFTILCDTSTRHVVMATEDAKMADGWRFCPSCEAVAPPRSWHCRTCDVCIMKRDHHCIFTGCCVGHDNHRYFLMFIFYAFVATVYAFVYNTIFMWNRVETGFFGSLARIVFPMAMFVFGFDTSTEQLYLMVYVMTAVGMCFTGALCVYHFGMVIKGCVADERAKGDGRWDQGLRRNVVEVFGERWWLALFVPYVASKLPRDGVSWRALSRSSKETCKSR